MLETPYIFKYPHLSRLETINIHALLKQLNMMIFGQK